jgi:hypothetical protein
MLQMKRILSGDGFTFKNLFYRRGDRDASATIELGSARRVPAVEQFGRLAKAREAATNRTTGSGRGVGTE